jgi:glycosyltransferase involved in cell wall biosynthesis
MAGDTSAARSDFAGGRESAACDTGAMRPGLAGGRAGTTGDIDPPCEVTIVAHDVGSVGGMERQLGELALGLRRLGHPVSVIAWTCALPPEAGVRLHRVRGPRRPFLLGYPAFMLAGTLAVRRHRRGVVQATGAIVCNRVDVVAIHCCHQVYRAAPRRPTAPFRAYVGLLGAIKRTAERLCLIRNRDARIVCVSNGVADELRKHYPAARERVLTIHNGVNTRAFAPGAHEHQARALRARLGIDPQRPVAAFVARGWGHKGLEYAIAALAEAPAWDLVVAGEGDRERFQALVERLDVAGRVHWLGVVGDVQVVYALADAFVLPSSYETFSLVAFEAAASGVPVLATPVNGVRELIGDGESGFLIGRDADTIAARLNQLASDPVLRERLGTAARAAALRFSWERMVDAHHTLYGTLVAENGSPTQADRGSATARVGSRG